MMNTPKLVRQRVRSTEPHWGLEGSSRTSMMGMNKGHYARVTVCDLAHNKVYLSLLARSCHTNRGSIHAVTASDYDEPTVESSLRPPVHLLRFECFDALPHSYGAAEKERAPTRYSKVASRIGTGVLGTIFLN